MLTQARVGVAGFIPHLWVAGIIPVRLGSFGRGLGLPVSFEFVSVHSARLRVAWFIQIRLGSFGRSERSPRSFRFACVHSGAPRGHWFHSDSLGLTFARQGVAGFTRVRLGSLKCT